MVCSEWWAYEILTLLASQLGTYEVAAQTIIIQTASLTYMVPMGISIATASLVGNFLGADKADVAVRIGKVAIMFNLCCELVIGLSIFFLGRYLVDAYTMDDVIRQLCILIIPFLSCFAVFDGSVAIGLGILRGKQYVGAASNLVSFYVIGVPSAYFLCFHTALGVRGLIMGVSLGTSCQLVFLYSLIFCSEKYVYSSILPKNEEDEIDEEEQTTDTIKEPLDSALEYEDDINEEKLCRVSRTQTTHLPGVTLQHRVMQRLRNHNN
ncbi:unnamed protein product [Sphagnum jensenii]|uniref:MATE transporter n=1 Tax=Sphagnum jensenii TaxID=128206 RepID=A0ABP0V6E5_9BRYO